MSTCSESFISLPQTCSYQFSIVLFVFSIWSKFKISNFPLNKQIEIKISTPQADNMPHYSMLCSNISNFLLFSCFSYFCGDFVVFSVDANMTTICCCCFWMFFLSCFVFIKRKQMRDGEEMNRDDIAIEETSKLHTYFILNLKFECENCFVKMV